VPDIVLPLLPAWPVLPVLVLPVALLPVLPVEPVLPVLPVAPVAPDMVELGVLPEVDVLAPLPVPACRQPCTVIFSPWAFCAIAPLVVGCCAMAVMPAATVKVVTHWNVRFMMSSSASASVHDPPSPGPAGYVDDEPVPAPMP
jgi:hypothetical protein